MLKLKYEDNSTIEFCINKSNYESSNISFINIANKYFFCIDSQYMFMHTEKRTKHLN